MQSSAMQCGSADLCPKEDDSRVIRARTTLAFTDIHRRRILKADALGNSCPNSRLEISGSGSIVQLFFVFVEFCRFCGNLEVLYIL